jgi:hypothetical protein
MMVVLASDSSNWYTGDDHAAGHGFIAGWAIAIAGDMLYFAVIAITTLRLNSYFKDPNTTMLIVLGAMIIVPMLVRYFRSFRSSIQRPEIE